jgi:hypothetical protein
MAADPSYQRALRLPRDFALIAVGLDAAVFAINMAVLLMRSSPDVEQIRSAYAQPEVWIMTLANLAMTWTLAAALAWSHGRNALEKQGVAQVALARDARLRFGGVWVLALVLSYYGLTPLFYEFRVLFMDGGRFEDFFGYSPQLAMGASMLLQSIVQLVVLVLGLWIAARVALSRRRGATSVRAEDDAMAEVPGLPPRRAVATVVAAVFASIQLWSGLAVANGASRSSGMDVPQLLLTWVLPSLVAFALAFWGGWLGTRPGLPQVRPFRAVAASVLAFVLVQVVGAVIAAAWLFIAFATSMRLNGMAGLIGTIAVFALVYMALVVALTFAITRRLYRRFYL